MEYKFYVLTQKEGCSYQERFADFGKAQEAARRKAQDENEAIYVLGAVWVCRPVQRLDEQYIKEAVPQAI